MALLAQAEEEEMFTAAAGGRPLLRASATASFRLPARRSSHPPRLRRAHLAPGSRPQSSPRADRGPRALARSEPPLGGRAAGAGADSPGRRWGAAG